MFSKKVKTIVKIDGMSCEHCANKVKVALEKVDDVKSVKVNLKKKEAVLTSVKFIDRTKIKDVIEDLDYKVIFIEEA